MDIQFQKAKNGSDTCALNGIFLHSSYNPEREAEQFVTHLPADFTPACVLIVEPGLSYCVPALRKRFPGAELCCIRFLTDASCRKTDAAWDYVFTPSGNEQEDAEQLYSHFGEEKLCALLAANWTASVRAFPEQTQYVWKAIKSSVVKSRDVLYTRAYFSKRWLKNSVHFIRHLHSIAGISPASQPVVVAASGPSLKSVIPLLKEKRDCFFLLAVSSAYLPLKKAGLTPDLTITTDGGWWAKAHIQSPEAPCAPLIAAATECALPSRAFEDACILPLTYEDSPSVSLFDACSIPHISALRNGTVSGTALSFALSLTSGDIFLCGLDLASGIGFQHTQPNALEIRASQYDFRLKSAETRIAGAQFSSNGSLALYRSWFKSHTESVKNRVFRFSAGGSYAESLAPLTDVGTDFFCSRMKKAEHAAKITFSEKRRIEHDEKKLSEAVRRLFADEKWDMELFPLESVMLKRSTNPEERARYRNTIAEEKASLLQELLHE